MTITLEQIEEMKIPVGTPIELTILYHNGPKYTEKLRKRLAYFGGLGKSKVSIAEEDILRCKKDPQNIGYHQVYHFEKIDEIKVLEYQD